MTPELTRLWPQVRIDPVIRKRFKTLLASAKNSMTVTKFVNAMLEESLNLIEHPGNAETPGINTLRSQLGLGDAKPAKGASQDMDRTIAWLQATIKELADTQSAMASQIKELEKRRKP